MGHLALDSPGTRLLRLAALVLVTTSGCTLYDSGLAHLEVRVVDAGPVRWTMTVRVIAPERVDKVAVTVDGIFARDGRTNTNLWVDISRLAPGIHRVGAVGDGSPWTVPAAEVPFTVAGTVPASAGAEAGSGSAPVPRCAPVASADLLHLAAHDELECRLFDPASGRELDTSTVGGIVLRDAAGAALPTLVASAGPAGSYLVSRGSGDGIPGAGSLTIEGLRDVAGLELPSTAIALAWPEWLSVEDDPPPPARGEPGWPVPASRPNRW